MAAQQPLRVPPKRDKVTVVSLLIGTAVAIAASKTKAAPLVVAILAAAVVFQVITV